MKKLKGTSMVEFALTLPILMLLIVGIIEFGVIAYNKAVITNASREGARYGVVFRSPSYATTTEIETFTSDYCTGKLITFSATPGNLVVTAVQSSSPPTFGDTLTVTVNYTYTDLVLHNFIGTNQQQGIIATTTMAYE